MEVTTNCCFVLWEQRKNGKISFDPVVYSSAAAAINEGEKRKDKSLIENYGYSVVMQPNIQ